jgi:hypothetical protein
MMLVSLSDSDAMAFIAAVHDAQIITSQVEQACALLAEVIEGGDHAGHFGLAAMTGLMARAMAGFGAAHNDNLAKLGTCLKQAIEVEALP